MTDSRLGTSIATDPALVPGKIQQYCLLAPWSVCAAPGLQPACTRRSSRITVAGLQAPRPLGVGTPRAVNALAIPLSVATPAARTSAITGRRDLFDMQDEIVARLAGALNAQLVAAEARRAEQAPNPD